MLIAYRQPITRGEIEQVRGVSVSSNIVKSLMERDWIYITGQRDVPGRPEMFGTTKIFLDYFGLKKINDLPPLADLSDWEAIKIKLDLPEVIMQDTIDKREVNPLLKNNNSPDIDLDNSVKDEDLESAKIISETDFDDIVEKTEIEDLSEEVINTTETNDQ